MITGIDEVEAICFSLTVLKIDKRIMLITGKTKLAVDDGDSRLKFSPMLISFPRPCATPASRLVSLICFFRMNQV